MRLVHGLAIGIIGVAIAFMQAEIAVTLTAQDVSYIAKKITVLISGPKLGSGVIIHRQGNIYTVLTNAHVVDEAATYTVQTADQSLYQVKPNSIAQMSGVDLAVLQFTSNQQYIVATIGNSDTVKEGTTVYVSGAPEPVRGIENRTVLIPKGEIVGKNPQPQDGYVLIYDNITFPGMSGGPILDENGHLIGIHGRGARDQDGQKVGFNLGIPIKIFTNSKFASNLEIVIQNTPSNFTDPPPTPSSPTVGRPSTFNGSGGATGTDVCPGRRC